jgi:glycosyltransferase involved in cell wall biosynthesis
MNSGPWHISVLIPARDEEKLIARCLRSVIAAKSNLPASVTYDVVVAVDQSTDRTQEIAEDLLQEHGTVVSIDAGAVGQARAYAAKIALQRYSGNPSRCWLVNTDADCEVPTTWLLDHLREAEDDIEAIAGIVDVDSYEEHEPEVRQRFRSSYLIRPDGTHPHVHGANLGVRADAYMRAGGWNPLATAEDHDLWNRLQSVGSKRAAVARICVTTSGRRIGRAPLGFAGALAAHNEVAI